MFIGRHGVGKTAMVKESFDRHKLKWQYFSASTMDPWCDFIGVPRERTENKISTAFEIVRDIAKVEPTAAITYVVENWKLDVNQAKLMVEHALRPEGQTFLDIVRPQLFASGDIEALFFDEFNRSPKKVRNAVMELIQFGSINGHKFPKLRFVWAAINPDDDEQEKYDVEVLDAAHKDRFPVQEYIPYKPNAEWFRKNYGQRLADSALIWWDELTDEAKRNVSPRRLQYAMDMYKLKGDVRDVLPINCNVNKLLTALKTGPITEKLEELISTRDEAETSKFLENENNFSSAIKHIIKSESFLEFFVPLMPNEKISSLMATDEKICNHIINNLDKVPAFHKISKEIMKANLDASLVKKLRRSLTENENLAKAFAKDAIECPKAPIQIHFNKRKTNWTNDLVLIKSMPIDSVNQRFAVYEKIKNGIPEKITQEESIETLKIINNIFSNNNIIGTTQERDRWQFASIVADSAFDKIFGIINHCLHNMHKESKLSIDEIIKNNDNNFNELFKTINQLGLNFKLSVS